MLPWGPSFVRGIACMAVLASCDGLRPLVPVRPHPSPPEAPRPPRVVDEPEGDDAPEPGRSVDAAWAEAIARPDQARRVTDLAVAAIGGGPLTSYRRYRSRHCALVDDGRSIIVTDRRQLVVLDASSLAPRGALRAHEIKRVEPVPNTSLFLARTAVEGSVLYDTRPLAVVHDFGHADVVMSPDRASFAVLEKPASFWIFDIATRSQRWRSVGNLALDSLTFTDGGRVVVARDTIHGLFTSETSTGQRLTTGTASSIAPAFSADGRFMAQQFSAKDGTALELAERGGLTALARTDACEHPFAMTFDPAGTRIAVGGTRRICMLHVPTLRLVATAGLGPSFGNSDGWDRVTPEFVSDGRAVFTGRRDGEAAVLDATTLKPTWRGRGRLVRLPGNRAVIDNGSRMLGEIGTGGRVTMREASAEEQVQLIVAPGSAAPQPDAATRGRLDAALCTIDGWLLPRPCP